MRAIVCVLFSLRLFYGRRTSISVDKIRRGESELSLSQQTEFTHHLFTENAKEYATLDTQKIYANDDDIVWQNNPKQWHQQLARIVDHRFSTFDELETFAKNAKKAGASALMLVQIQKTEACPGGWYNGLQLCDHINGSFPAADGNLEKWQKMLKDLKPMRLMWWTNMCYWSVQGQVWAQADADKKSDVGKFFSWGATTQDECWGNNPDGAQGSWGSDGSWKGKMSGLASWGSDSYAEYMVDSMANSWTKNLGIDGYCIDCIGCYQKGNGNCKNGMLQTNGDALTSWSKIVQKVRQLQPQVVLSAEAYGSWDEVIKSNSDVGGQGFENYHTVMQQAVFNGDASNLENVASTSGADAATVLCYLNPYYDGKQPGACPTMYFRDMTPTIENIRQHRLWVGLEAGSGIVSQHDFNPVWWNVTNDPFDDKESPLWAFTKYRALNRLALRTKLNVTGNRGALVYLKHDSMGPYGDACLMVFNPGNAGNVTIDLSMFPASLFGIVPYDLLKKTNSSSDVHAHGTFSDYTTYDHENCYNGHGGTEIDVNPVHGLSISQCKQRCDNDSRCDCVTYCSENTGACSGSQGDCWKRSHCQPSGFEKDSAAAPYSVYVKKTLPPTPLPPTPAPPPAPPLSKSWTVHMSAGEMRFYSGFSLGVFAPRKGKKASCKPDDQYSKKTTGTLQSCFLECLRDPKCENVYVNFVNIYWMEKPPPMQCTLLGAIKDPATACVEGTGTLVKKLPGARSCAHLWQSVGEVAPLALGAPPRKPGPPSPRCPHHG